MIEQSYQNWYLKQYEVDAISNIQVEHLIFIGIICGLLCIFSIYLYRNKKRLHKQQIISSMIIENKILIRTNVLQKIKQNDAAFSHSQLKIDLEKLLIEIYHFINTGDSSIIKPFIDHPLVLNKLYQHRLDIVEDGYQYSNILVNSIMLDTFEYVDGEACLVVDVRYQVIRISQVQKKETIKFQKQFFLVRPQAEKTPKSNAYEERLSIQTFVWKVHSIK